MKIVDIKASAHRIEVAIPLFDKPVITRKIVHCEVYTDSGIVGYGLTGGQFLPHSVVVALENEFLDTVKGLDPRNVEMIHEKKFGGISTNAL